MVRKLYHWCKGKGQIKAEEHIPIENSDERNRLCRQDEKDITMEVLECNGYKSTQECLQECIEEINNEIPDITIDSGEKGYIKSDPCVIDFSSDKYEFRLE